MGGGLRRTSPHSFLFPRTWWLCGRCAVWTLLRPSSPCSQIHSAPPFSLPAPVTEKLTLGLPAAVGKWVWTFKLLFLCQLHNVQLCQ